MKLLPLTELLDNRDSLSDALCAEYSLHEGLPNNILDLKEDTFRDVLEPVVNLAGYVFDRDEVIRLMLY